MSADANDNNETTPEARSLSRRRALGLGAAVAGGVWAAPVIMSFDAASATSSGGAPTTSTTYVAPTTTESTTTTTEAPPTTTTTIAPRTITASVTGSLYGVTNPSPVTVSAGQPIDLVFTSSVYGNKYIWFSTVNGTAVAGTDFTARTNQYVIMAPGDATKTVTIQTTATGPGANRAFTVNVFDNT